MIKRFLIFLITIVLLSTHLFSQIQIKGKVLYKSKPVEKAAIFLNNTIKGTITDKNGEFIINVENGNHQIIVSHIGFKTILYDLNTDKYDELLVFHLEEEEMHIQEITVNGNIREYNLANFRKEFIGTGIFSKYCELLNPDILFFDFDEKNKIFTANANKTLHIRNKALGYDIDYILEYFVIDSNKTTFLGYSQFKELKGNRRQQRKWKKNRLLAYNGSRIHFFKSVLTNTAKQEGFIINQFKRRPNEQRPSEDEIKAARKKLSRSNSIIDFSRIIDTPKNAVDSALIVLRKVKLPKYVDYLYKSNITDSCLIKISDNKTYLDFENNILVTYTKEKEEQAYILRGMFSKPRKALAQTSNIIPIKLPIIVYKSGILAEPLSVLYENYWSFEKLAYSLPLDYEPPRQK